MTTILRQLIRQAEIEVTKNICSVHGHDWVGEGGRRCPMGAEQCSQTVYVCRSCGQYDYGDRDDSPGKADCVAVCGQSMTGWQNGPLDPNWDHY